MMEPSSGYTPQPLAARTRDAARQRGIRPVAGDLVRWGSRLVTGAPWTLAGRHGTFELAGERHAYLYHRYKRSWLTERAVEVPVAQAEVDRSAGARILEIGHVLGHYRQDTTHVVVDKYERAPGVLNRDVLDLGGLGAFDLIVAVSTLEHVGYDESPRDPAAATRAVAALRERLAPGGRLLVTIPAGYNPAFDAAIAGGTIPTRSLTALRRVGGATRWREVEPDEAWGAPYDFLLYSARAVLFAVIDADEPARPRERG
jgi:SAM-dependent methyltransferase